MFHRARRRYYILFVFTNFLEHDDDITFFSLSQIFLSTTTILHSHRFQFQSNTTTILHFFRFHKFLFIKHIYQSQLMFVSALARLTQFFFVFKNFAFRKLFFIKIFIRILFSDWTFLFLIYDNRFVQETNN